MMKGGYTNKFLHIAVRRPVQLRTELFNHSVDTVWRGGLMEGADGPLKGGGQMMTRGLRTERANGMNGLGRQPLSFCSAGPRSNSSFPSHHPQALASLYLRCLSPHDLPLPSGGSDSADDGTGAGALSLPQGAPAQGPSCPWTDKGRPESPHRPPWNQEEEVDRRLGSQTDWQAQTQPLRRRAPHRQSSRSPAGIYPTRRVYSYRQQGLHT